MRRFLKSAPPVGATISYCMPRSFSGGRRLAYILAKIVSIIPGMKVSVAEARNSLTKLLRRVEEGEQVTITRHGRAVARLSRAEKPKHKPRLGTLKTIPKPGWDTDTSGIPT